MTDWDWEAPLTSLPKFRTAGDRDRRFADWVAAGNILRDGMMCWVDGWLVEFRAGEWRRP